MLSVFGNLPTADLSNYSLVFGNLPNVHSGFSLASEMELSKTRMGCVGCVVVRDERSSEDRNRRRVGRMRSQQSHVFIATIASAALSNSKLDGGGIRGGVAPFLLIPYSREPFRQGGGTAPGMSQTFASDNDGGACRLPVSVSAVVRERQAIGDRKPLRRMRSVAREWREASSYELLLGDEVDGFDSDRLWYGERF